MPMPFSENKMPVDRSPIDEVAKRVSEAGGGLAAAAKAIAIENYRANQQSHRRRLADDHKLGMKLNGLEPSEQAQPEDDLVGDVIVTGDIYSDRAIQALSRGDTAAPEVSAPDPAQPSLLAKAVPYVLAGTLGAAGVGAPWMYSALTEEKVTPPAVAATDTDTQYILELVPNEPE